MSQYDRGSQGGGAEPPLRFEARDQVRPPTRARGPAPITLILSVLILAAIGGGVFFLYRGGVRGPNDAPQPVGAPISDVRTAAPVEKQPQDPAVGLSIYKESSADNTVAPAFAPPPEQPTPRPGAAPAPTVAQTGARAAPAQSSPAPLPVTPITPPPHPPQATVVATATPSPAERSVAPAKSPAVVTKAPAAAKPATTDDADAPDAEPAAKAPSSGGVMVQIGAFSSTQQADKGWSSAAGVAPGAMAGKGKKVEVVTRDGQTFYRTSITGFATREQAQALCAKLKAANKSCFVR